MGMVAGANEVGNGLGEVAPVSFLMARGFYADDPRLPGPNGSLLAVGDRWPYPIEDAAMAVVVEARADGVKLFLTLRVDRLSAREWMAFAAMPTCLTLLATPPVAWFLIEYHGGHSRAALPLNTGAAGDAALRAKLARPRGLADEVVFFGVAGDTIRCAKVGLALDRVWQLLAGALAATPCGLDLRAYRRVLDRYRPVDPGLMFSAAMRLHLAPR